MKCGFRVGLLPLSPRVSPPLALPPGLPAARPPQGPSLPPSSSSTPAELPTGAINSTSSTDFDFPSSVCLRPDTSVGSISTPSRPMSGSPSAYSALSKDPRRSSCGAFGSATNFQKPSASKLVRLLLIFLVLRRRVNVQGPSYSCTPVFRLAGYVSLAPARVLGWRARWKAQPPPGVRAYRLWLLVFLQSLGAKGLRRPMYRPPSP